MKERFGLTDMAKNANRVKFGVEEAETIEGEGLGMLGQEEGGGLLRVKTTQSKLAAKAAKKFKVLITCIICNTSVGPS